MNEDMLLDENEEITEQNETDLEFECPNCGKISQDDVIFICNKCESKDMILKEGTYFCPQCLVKGENFMCNKCDSKEVKLKTKL